MKKLKTAIIGLGRMGAEPSDRLGNMPPGWKPVSHAETIITTDNLELSALCDIDEKRVHRFSSLYTGVLGFTNYEVLIDEVKPEIISIATRTDVKEDIIYYALNHGVKGIYVEKPLANSINRCKEILRAAHEKQVLVSYGTQRRGMAVFRQVKEMIHSGILGEIQSIQFEYGSGLLLWSMPHVTDLMVFLSGTNRFTELSALCTFSAPFDEDKLFLDCDPFVESAFVRMENGINAVITPGIGPNVRIHLKKGTIAVCGDGLYIETTTEVEYKDIRSHSVREYSGEAKSGTQVLFQNLADCVLDPDADFLFPAEDIIGGMELLVGIVESGLRKGKLIAYDDIRPDLVVTGRYGNFLA